MSQLATRYYREDLANSKCVCKKIERWNGLQGRKNLLTYWEGEENVREKVGSAVLRSLESFEGDFGPKIA